MDNQDWTPQVIHGKTAAKTAAPVKISTAEAAHAAKLDREELPKSKKLAAECRIALTKARVEKKLTQTQLNQKLSLPKGAINDFESGKGDPSPGQLQLINRELGLALHYER